MARVNGDRSTLANLVRLTGFYAAWKLLLLVVVATSPGPGYDTSTAITIYEHSVKQESVNPITELIQRLTRWDGIYFATNSALGYTYEQQWAFSWAATRLSYLLANGECRHAAWLRTQAKSNQSSLIPIYSP